MESAYDPPIDRRPSRGRSSSVSASSAPRPSVLATSRTRRQSLSSAPTSDSKRPSLGLSDDEADHPLAQEPLVDLDDNYRASLDGHQDPEDAAADRAVEREGRQSKQQRLSEDPNYHATGDMEQFMAQLLDLTHTIDALDNDIDEIVAMRNRIVSLKPSVDVGQSSLQGKFHVLAALTTDSGKRIVSLETWLLQLHKWSKEVKKLVKSGKAGETMAEVGEIKFQLANAKLDFAAAMERIREGAYKEQQKRERTRIWMARHIRAREPEIEDEDVKGLLEAAELGSADGVAQSHVTSYAGLWALQNPFTEIAELTHGMRFLHDELDREIVDHVTGKDQPKRITYLNGVYARQRPNLSAAVPTRVGKKTVSLTQPRSWFGTRSGGVGGASADDKVRYIQAKLYASEKDLEYGFARRQQLDRTSFRKKMVIALLLVVIAALVLFISLATMRVPGELTSLAPDAFQPPTSSFVWGQGDESNSPILATGISSVTSAPDEGHPNTSDSVSPLVATTSDRGESTSRTSSLTDENSSSTVTTSATDVSLTTETGQTLAPKPTTPVTQSLTDAAAVPVVTSGST